MSSAVRPSSEAEGALLDLGSGLQLYYRTVRTP